MAKPFNFGEINLIAGDAATSAVPDSETPFCIAILGDFSGRANRHICDPTSIATRRALLVDRDNFDQVTAKIAPEIHLPLGGKDGTISFRFSNIDDFHPDQIFQRSPMFERLRDLRSRLSNPETFASTADELGIGSRPQSQTREPAPVRPAPEVSGLAGASLLDAMIESSESGAPTTHRQRRDEVQEFARRVSESSAVAAADPRQTEVVAMIDRATGGQMRALLHVPDFQALEAAWRALFLLIRRIETNSLLKLYLIDISQAELAADLTASTDLRATGTYKLLVERSVRTPGAEPWTLLVGNYTFGPQREDVELLGKLGKVASAAGAPFIAGASPRLQGCTSFERTPEPRSWNLTPELTESWAALRGLREASSLGLVLPRFLLRLPYGKKTDAIESFDFEEVAETPAHEDYLWGNSAFICALLLAQSFSEAEWEMRPGAIAEIDRLPLHAYERDGEQDLKPCAETLLTEDAAEQMMEHGLMPLASLKGRGAVRLVRFQSIAAPLRALAGRWAYAQ